MTLGIGSLLSWGIGIFTLGYISKKFDWFTILMFWRVVTWAFAPIFMRVKRPFHFEKINTLMFILLVGIIDILGAVFYAFSATKGMISIVGPIAALFPAVTIVLARIFLKEKLIFNQKIGVVSILVGLVLLSI